ncbi:DUF6115 domain-containing protein [Virgibacillus ndiopensis]|uniref:DUF6115 domain-containing protein n=1 Tax=Virgibacillus ndiopensis TaxID=2004408 RepID=UPI000C0704E9|nr:hypothetical protein [Virgibacillus ndiopensis]
MTAFIFLISFLLHIIALAAIAQLLKQIKQLKQRTHSEDVIELLEAYLQEIKEENRILEEKLHNNSLQKKRQTVDEVAQEKSVDHQKNPKTDDSEKDYKVLDIEADDTSETSLQARILQLHAQGLSTETIAKELNCGKTETELIIKLHNKNDNKA